MVRGKSERCDLERLSRKRDLDLSTGRHTCLPAQQSKSIRTRAAAGRPGKFSAHFCWRSVAPFFCSVSGRSDGTSRRHHSSVERFSAQDPHARLSLRRPALEPTDVVRDVDLHRQPTDRDAVFRRSAARVRLDQPDAVSFERVLSNWDGTPVARLIVRNTSPIVQELEHESQALMLSIVLFALLLLLLISSSLFRWVRRPLRTIRQSLNHNEPALLAPLANDLSEFGQLARILQTFFGQRDELIREIEEIG